MVRADITTPAGTKIIIDGDKREVAEIVDFFQRRELYSGRMRRGYGRCGGPIRNGSLTAAILDLKSQKFFDAGRAMTEIKKALERKGLDAPLTTLPAVLIRLVFRGELSRKSDGGVWKYYKNNIKFDDKFDYIAYWKKLKDGFDRKNT